MNITNQITRSAFLIDSIANKSGTSIIELMELREKIVHHEKYIRDAKDYYNYKVRGLSLDLSKFDD